MNALPQPSLDWRYPVIMAAAIFSGVWLKRTFDKPLDLTRLQRVALGLGAFCGGMLGAKLPYVLLAPRGFLGGAAWLGHGKTLLAGLAGGYLGVELAKRLCGVTRKTGDNYAAPVALAVGIGRLACFSAGCCYGTPASVPWAMDFGDGVGRHPTQLYESLFHLAAAATLAALRSRGLLRRQLMKLYIIAYCVYRFATEYLRPEPEVFAGFTPYQLGALALVVIFAGLWLLDRKTPEACVPAAAA